MTKDMTKGSPMKLILGFSIPLFFGFLFQQFYSLVDTVIVGRFLGKENLAAVGAYGAAVFCYGHRQCDPAERYQYPWFRCGGSSNGFGTDLRFSCMSL